MDESTIQVTAESDTENYTVYESADGDTIVGAYIADEIAETLGEFASITVGSAEDADENATTPKKKDTTNYGVFELPPAVKGMYISHDVLESDETEEGDREAPENIGLSLSPSDEEAFENSLPDAEEQADALVEGDDSDEEESEPSTEEQADALVSGADTDSDESDDEPAEESEEVEISDEEVGLVDAE